MRRKKLDAATTRAEIVAAAGRGFRQNGYGSLGVDGLAKAAGVTSGAFYGHFKSKEAAFHAAVIQGLQDYHDGLRQFQAEGGKDWYRHFLDYYLGDAHRDNLDQGCAVPALTTDVIRAPLSLKRDYEKHLQHINQAMTQGLQRDEPGKAWAIIALLAGAVMLERAVADKAVAREIADAVRHAAETL
jgi:AcrR family transcriptional regulator